MNTNQGADELQQAARVGPRPLFLQLSLALGKLPLDPADSLKPTSAYHEYSLLVEGIAAYRKSSFFRVVPKSPAVWSQGSAQLFKYAEQGPKILFVPSLINRAYILDLLEERSLMRYLASRGLAPYLLDWGWPDEEEKHFTITDYCLHRLLPAINALEGPVVLVGYCMGGVLALAAALRCQSKTPEKIKALALFATPWDFHATEPALAQRVGQTLTNLEPFLRLSGTLPVDALNALFALVNPDGVAEKFKSFARQDQTSERAKIFVAIEDWLADGVPLAAPVARETLSAWYVANAPARLAWRVADMLVDPRSLNVPSFCAIPTWDRLVPAPSARGLALNLPDCRIIEPMAGHIGMVVGADAKTRLWEPFVNWLRGLW